MEDSGPPRKVKQNRNVSAALSCFQLHTRFLNKPAKLCVNLETL